MELDISLEVSSIRISLRMKLSIAIISVVIFVVGLISILVNFYIKDEFKNYIVSQKQKTTYEIVNDISKEYSIENKKFNLDAVHSIGMNALYDGYIIKLYDSKDISLWDAKECDGNLCEEVMMEITSSMEKNFPRLSGEFVSKEVDVNIQGEIVGKVEINYYGPFFLNDEDFNYLNSLNKVLILVGALAIIVSAFIGSVIAKKISEPIKKTVEATKQISTGEYKNRIEEGTNTIEVKELIISINNLAASLEKQENLRKALTADIAHEFRTPLTTLQTHMEAMIEGIWEADLNRLQSCHDEIRRISSMVKDLENLAKIESDNLKLNKSEISLIDISRKVVNNLQSETNKKRLSVNVSGEEIKVIADKARITQVISNLLTNAIKYTNYNGNILISVSQEEEFVVLEIIDNGIGIQKEELPYIFERLYRTDKSRNSATGGSGIGLTIVKSIVTAHGGKVVAISEFGKGSRFIVKLPNAKTII